MEGSSQTSAYITPTYIYRATQSFIIEDYTYVKNGQFSMDCNSDMIYLTDCLILSIALLGICFTVYGLYSLIKTGHAAAVYVINLFISDLIQTSVKVIQISIQFCIGQKGFYIYDIMHCIYTIGVVSNICFMVVISAERYVMIVYPVWYHNTFTYRASILVSVTAWITLCVISICFFLLFPQYLFVGAFLIQLLPYPLVIFFFVGTWRALSRNTTLPLNEQRRIMGTLALVLCIYTVLFLPTVLAWFGYEVLTLCDNSCMSYLRNSANILLAINPLFDFVLYLIMRRDAKDVLCALFFCFCKRYENSRITETLSKV